MEEHVGEESEHERLQSAIAVTKSAVLDLQLHHIARTRALYVL
jgi:hypothetical protein